MNSPTSQTLVLRQPDDWHVHLRDGAMLGYVANFTAEQFDRAIIMPNLAEPVTTFAAADAYRSRILAALNPGSNFTPLMTCFLTDDIKPEEIEQGYKDGVFTAAKLYPLNATTNSSQGVTDIRLLHPVLIKMQELGMPLLVHGEVSDQRVDIFDREATFIKQILGPLALEFPELKIVLEHITTSQAVAFVETAGPNVAATITPHHLMLDRNAMFVGGICPHHYCLPILKRDTHKLELRRAATSGSTKFFLGTDSAPHAVGDKEAACGCAGIFNAPYALECYAQVFEEEGALQHLEAFASENGPRFYGLPLNEGRVVLERQQTPVPARLTGGGTELVPFQAGQELAWRFAGREI